MKPQSKCTSWNVVTRVALLWIVTAPAFAIDKPKPAPRPGTLGAYAQRVTLDRTAVNATGQVVLTNSDVAGIARGVRITLGSVDPQAIAEPAVSKGTNESERERWTRAHRKQKQVIAGLNQRRSLIEIDVAILDDQRPTPKLLARLEQARAKLRHVEQQIANEKEILARIVREARQHGAQPDWFR